MSLTSKEGVMTVEEVWEKVASIKAIGDDDPNKTHCLEDALWVSVLLALSKENPIALEALKTQQLDFARWYS